MTEAVRPTAADWLSDWLFRHGDPLTTAYRQFTFHWTQKKSAHSKWHTLCCSWQVPTQFCQGGLLNELFCNCPNVWFVERRNWSALRRLARRFFHILIFSFKSLSESEWTTKYVLDRIFRCSLYLKNTFCHCKLLLRLTVGRSSAVGTVTRYGLNGPGIESRWERDFLHSSSLLYSWYRVFSGCKAGGTRRWQPTNLAPRLKKEYSYTPTPTMGPRSLFWGDLRLYLTPPHLEKRSTDLHETFYCR